MRYTAIAGVILVLVLFFIVGAIIYGQSASNVTITTSTLILNPSPTPSYVKAPDPIVTSWKDYQNTNYNFSLSYPETWAMQEYTPQSGDFQVAFSPNSLPCSTCSYVHDGFFSVKVFNQKIDPQDYTAYTQRKENIAKNKNDTSVQIAGKTAIVSGNLIDIENNGWVFELSLDKDNGTDKVTDSQLFQKAALSLQFTNIQFNY